ncbi:MAG: deoxyribose-phosphate aldolase [Thermotoga sp.]|nr:MAG: deoxyribose-phosphate aldolase [Thermotoga sp.]
MILGYDLGGETIVNLNEKIREVVGRFRREFKYVEVIPDSSEVNLEKIGKLIDQTLLKPYATINDLRVFVEKSLNYPFHSLCVPLSYLEETKKIIERSGKDMKITTVVGFPHGNIPTRIKVEETRYAVDHGADEIDMVINVGFLKSGMYDLIFEEVKSVVENSGDLIVKVIIETCYLTDEEKIAGSVISKEAGANFVKTSTGFGEYGANTRDIEIMRFAVEGKVGIKAAGGIRDLEFLLKCVKAGAERIGTSRGIEILEEVKDCLQRRV